MSYGRWASYGRSRQSGIRHAYKRARGILSPMRCVPSLPASVWEAIFGIRSRILSVNGFADQASARVDADLMSTTGVPSNASIEPIFLRVPSISRTVTGGILSGFGRARERRC
jgi:hypothetical protein